uniref:Uncharacterized protein n=1 Tax=Anopheles atroparvus TaxID=41427 RepID=A0A182J4H2_ANOAO
MEDGGADPDNNNSSHCGMLGISMPCEGAGHDFSTVRKELEYANAIAAHYGAPASEKNDRVISYKIEPPSQGGSNRVKTTKALERKVALADGISLRRSSISSKFMSESGGEQ